VIHSSDVVKPIVSIFANSVIQAILSLEVMSNYNFYVGGLPTQLHNPQPGGPVDCTSSDPYPLTCLA
jgi:hypothetical protein